MGDLEQVAHFAYQAHARAHCSSGEASHQETRSSSGRPADAQFSLFEEDGAGSQSRARHGANLSELRTQPVSQVSTTYYAGGTA